MKQLPTPDEIARIRRESLLDRAVQAYKFFYPTLSMVLNFEALDDIGAKPNRGVVIQLTTPDIVTLTQNSDTPYGLAWGDASAGPIVIEIPEGPLMGVVDDTNFQFVTNMGIVGEEEGAGARYVFLAPGYDGEVPDGYLARRLRTNHFLMCRNYALSVPAPVPAGQFWSVTLYDLDTRSEINTEQFKPVLTSLRDHLEPGPDGNIAMRFGPDRPDDASVPWLQTNPGAQWFAYFRVYGPGKEAFDGSWKPSDFEVD